MYTGQIPSKKIILYDGVCNLCTTSVQFVLKRDLKNQFVFASLQSNIGQSIICEYQIPVNKLDSFVLISDNTYFTQSTAALKVAKELNAFWPLLHGFMLVPRFIRDSVYKYIAKKRYKWFGKNAVCWIPSEALKQKFLT